MNELSEQEIQRIRDTYDTKTGEWISTAWQVLTKDLGSFIGYFLLYLVISIVIQFIPFVGGIAMQVIAPALMAGFMIVAHAILKGKSYTFSSFFDGFKFLGDLFLASLVKGLIGVLIILIPLSIGAAMVLTEISLSEITDSPEYFIMDYGPQLAIYMLIGMIPVIYLAIAWMFTEHLIVLRGLKFWPAMKASKTIISKKWLNFFGFAIVLGLINILGALALGIGILITAPLTIVAMYTAFEDVIGSGDHASVIDEIIQENE